VVILIEKLNRIQEFIFEHKQVSLKELMEVFDLSESTVRRYINKLEEQDLIHKEYGYVVANTNDNLVSIKARIDYLSSEKQKISHLASVFIHDGDTIFIDSGTTHMYLTQWLKHKKDVTVVTNNLLFAIKAVDEDIPCDVILIHGSVNKKTISVSGDASIRLLDEFYFDTCFITVSGISLTNGCSNRTSPEAQIKRKIISRSKVKVLMADDTKFDKVFPFSFGQINDFDVILTNQKPSLDYLEEVEKGKTRIVWE
jgi:DeoR family myo-inositol catabolism operon transcriptional repressor